MYQYRVLFSQRGTSECRGEFIEAYNAQEALDGMDSLRGPDDGFKSLEFVGPAPVKTPVTGKRPVAEQSNSEWLGDYERG